MDDPDVHDRLRVPRIGAWFTVVCALFYGACFSMTRPARRTGEPLRPGAVSGR